jgi:hypothetical protein
MPDPRRVITRSFVPGEANRIRDIIERLCSFSAGDVETMLARPAQQWKGIAPGPTVRTMKVRYNQLHGKAGAGLIRAYSQAQVVSTFFIPSNTIGPKSSSTTSLTNELVS